MDNGLEFARKKTVELLQDGAPEPGARLKQRLQREFLRGGERFDERQWGFAKFIEFLEANGDLVTVENPPGPGDITVRLKVGADASAPAPAELGLRVREPQAPVIPTVVWQAFTNPDPQRKRFVNRESGQILHFVIGEDSAEEREITASPAKYAQIEFVSASEHSTWMREFLASFSAPERIRSVLDVIAAMPFTSSVDQAFTNSLPPVQAHSWKQFRAAKVFGHITGWALSHVVSLPTLSLPTSEIQTVSKRDELATTGASNRRYSLHSLIDAFTTSATLKTRCRCASSRRSRRHFTCCWNAPSRPGRC